MSRPREKEELLRAAENYEKLNQGVHEYPA